MLSQANEASLVSGSPSPGDQSEMPGLGTLAERFRALPCSSRCSGPKRVVNNHEDCARDTRHRAEEIDDVAKQCVNDDGA